MTAKVDPGETTRFLEVYAEALAEGLGQMVLFTLPNRQSFASREVASLAQYAARQAQAGLDVYFHVHLHDLPEGESFRRGRIETARAAIGVFCDLDACGPGRRKPAETLCPTVADSLLVIDEFNERYKPLQVSLVIGSGYGCYPTILLKEPLVFEQPQDKALLESLGRRFHAALHRIASRRGWSGAADFCDLAKVLRLPGSVNWKDASSPKPVRLLSEEPARFTLGDLDDLLPHREDEPEASTGFDPDTVVISINPDPKGDVPDALLDALVAEDPKFAATWNHQRGDLRDQSCSGYDMALADIGVDRGLTDQQIAGLLTLHRTRFPGKKQERFGSAYQRYLRRTIAKARQVGPSSEEAEQQWAEIRQQVEALTPDNAPDQARQDGGQPQDSRVHAPVDFLLARLRATGDVKVAYDSVDAIAALPDAAPHHGETPSTAPDKPGPQVVPMPASAIERLRSILSDCRTTGRAQRLFEVAGLLAAVTDGEFNDFLGDARRAVAESTGLRIDLQMLKRLRREALAKLQVNQGDDEDATSPAALATKILTDDHFAVDPGGKLYVYRGGCYRPDGSAVVDRAVKRILTEMRQLDRWSSHRADETAKYIAVDAPEFWEFPFADRLPPMDQINLLNGILDVRTRELMPHRPDFLWPVQLPVKYDPAAQCPGWEKFISEVFPEDAWQLAWEIPAWLMTPDTSLQKAILLLGDGANGKSTYLRAVLAFIGRRNASAISLHKLETDRFSAARLVGRLANICPDLPSTDLASTSAFKSIVGGDVIMGERKYEDAFEFTPFARLLFSANHPPRSQDASPAFYRRWLVVPFERTFVEGAPGTIPRDELDAMLADSQELSGVLNRALDALQRLRTHGFTETDSTRLALDEFRQATDPVAVFLDRHTILHPNAMVPRNRLYAEYSRDCRDAGRPLISRTAFGLAVKKHRPTVVDRQRTINGTLAWCYVGIGLLAEEQN